MKKIKNLVKEFSETEPTYCGVIIISVTVGIVVGIVMPIILDILF